MSFDDDAAEELVALIKVCLLNQFSIRTTAGVALGHILVVGYGGTVHDHDQVWVV